MKKMNLNALKSIINDQVDNINNNTSVKIEQDNSWIENENNIILHDNNTYTDIKKIENVVSDIDNNIEKIKSLPKLNLKTVISHNKVESIKNDDINIDTQSEISKTDIIISVKTDESELYPDYSSDYSITWNEKKIDHQKLKYMNKITFHDLFFNQKRKIIIVLWIFIFLLTFLWLQLKIFTTSNVQESKLSNNEKIELIKENIDISSPKIVPKDTSDNIPLNDKTINIPQEQIPVEVKTKLRKHFMK